MVGRVFKQNDMLGRHLLKLLSLLLSAFLWFYVLNSEPQVVEREFDLKVISPKGLSIGSELPKTINVSLEGSRAFLRNAFTGEESVLIDLRKYPYKKKKSFKVKISNSDVHAPFGIDVLGVGPEFLEVKLEKEITKKVPLRPQFVGEVPADLKMVKYKITPSSIFISGPIETMRQIGKLRTTPIELDGLSGQEEIVVGIQDVDHRVRIKDPELIKFKYDIRPKKANLTLKRIPIRFLTSARRYKSRSKYVSLSVLAPDNVKIRKKDIHVIADIPEGSKGNTTVTLRADLPDGVHLLQINPQKIRVNVR